MATPGDGGRARIAALLRGVLGPANRFWLLVIAVGAISGVSAAGLMKLLRWVQRLAWGGAEGPFLSTVTAVSPSWRFVIPVLGGALVVLVTLIVGQPLRGHGTAGIIESIWVKSGKLPLPRALLRGTVSILAVALGAPLGREGALLQTGGAMGSSLARWFRSSPDQARLLVACGAASGMAAAYNVPIGAALFGLEVLLGSFALELFGPIVVACVVATLFSRSLIADHPSYVIPHYALTRPREVILTVGLGLLLGAASAAYSKSIHHAAGLLDKVPRRLAPYLPIATMAVVGACAVWLPQVLGNGYDTVNGALLGSLPLTLLLLLPFAKLGATAVASASGVPGGLFTPSLFFGALLGGGYGHLAAAVWPGSAPPGAYALLGMGAVLAGTTHASVSAVLIIFELTGDYGLILPLMLAAVLATGVSRRLEKESLYTAALKQRNVHVPAPVAPDWLRSEGIRSLLRPVERRVAPTTSFQEVIVLLLEQPPGMDLYVTDDAGRLLGVVILDQLKGHLPDHAVLQMIVAADVMDRELRPIDPECSLAELASRFSETALERLPVVDRERRLLGTISKGDLFKRVRF